MKRGLQPATASFPSSSLSDRDAHRALEARLRVPLPGLGQKGRVGRRLADRALARRDLVPRLALADEGEAVGGVVSLHEAGVAALDDGVVLLGVVGEAVFCCFRGLFFFQLEFLRSWRLRETSLLSVFEKRSNNEALSHPLASCG